MLTLHKRIQVFTQRNFNLFSFSNNTIFFFNQIDRDVMATQYMFWYHHQNAGQNHNVKANIYFWKQGRVQYLKTYLKITKKKICVYEEILHIFASIS